MAVTIGMGGAIVLLLAGTQILEWYWVVLLPAASLGTGLYRFRKSIPSAYKLAQRMDRRLNLADALSTATYFSSNQERGHQAIRERQRQEAESIARTVDLRQGVPFTRPRYAYAAAGVALVACGLFAVRYAVTGSLSLQPSLVRIAFDTFFTSKPELAKANTRKPRDARRPEIEPGSPEGSTAQNDMAPDSVLDTVDVPDVNPKGTDHAKSAAQEGHQADPANDAKGENSDKGDESSAGNDANQDHNQPGDSKNGKQQQNAKQDSKQGSANENSSMMDKLRDAMANLVNKMKSQKDGESSQSAQNGKKGGQQDKSSQKSQQAQNRGQNADADAQGEQQQSDNGDKKPSSDSRGNEKSSDKSTAQDSKSGIGSSDGDKAAREAEQLAAMGKISEILGKRSAQVTGEVMVEVGSSKQQLKTPWAQRQASHAEAGSEIHRDEVPLMYQQFVQQYFEEIRKTPGKPAPRGPGSE